MINLLAFAAVATALATPCLLNLLWGQTTQPNDHYAV
jgi:hypothetical protein